MPPLLCRSALDLAAGVRAGELTASQLVEASWRRIEELDGEIGAFTHVAAESALETAAGIGPGDPRPFAGVPIAIKDNRAVAGMPLTMGSDLFAGITPTHDAYCVARLRAAGFVIVGKTSMPEMGILPTTEPRRFGPTANPWDPGRTPGGSSGGAAAAVAAGMVPVAHGNDGGGSLRIPASCCGLVGLKPARGRVSSGPESGQSFLSCDGVLTRDVADTAAILDVLAGYEPGDASWAPPPPGTFAELTGRVAAGPPLRIGLALTPPLEGARIDAVCAATARRAAEALSELGHAVSEVDPPWTGLDLLPDFTRAFGPLVSMQTLAGARLAGREPTADDVEPLTWELWERARGLDSLTYLAAQSRLEAVARSIVAFMADLDLLLTPTLATPPVATGAIHGRGPDAYDHYRRSGEFTPFTPIINVTGQPAISIPFAEDADGLPVGVHLVGRPAREDVVLGIARQLEEALPWSGRLAPPARDVAAR